MADCCISSLSVQFPDAQSTFVQHEITDTRLPAIHRSSPEDTYKPCWRHVSFHKPGFLPIALLLWRKLTIICGEAVAREEESKDEWLQVLEMLWTSPASIAQPYI